MFVVLYVHLSYNCDYRQIQQVCSLFVHNTTHKTQHKHTELYILWHNTTKE